MNNEIEKNTEDGKYCKNNKFAEITMVWPPAQEIRTFDGEENVEVETERKKQKRKQVLEDLKEMDVVKWRQ